jgi:hypothetical protein
MIYQYDSIFDGASIITKKDLCALLNLDLERANLHFTTAEINLAYRKRALRFHPDRQKNYDQPIPVDICNKLMSDISTAKDHLLAGEDNIQGKAFKNNFSFESTQFVDTLIHGLKTFKETKASIESLVSWFSWFSTSFVALLPLSTYSDGQLNLRYINILAKELAEIRPFIKNIDGSTAAQFLYFLREQLLKVEDINPEEFTYYLKAVSPELIESILKEKKLDELLLAVKESRDELKKLLTDEFIIKTQHIISFWPQFLSTLPTWRHLGTVFFITMLFTATSMPKFLNAFKVFCETIIEHKGMGVFALSLLPLIALSLLSLPLNIIIHLSRALAWLSLKAAGSLIFNGVIIALSAAKLLVIFSAEKSNYSLEQEGFLLLEACFNLFIRLPINTTLDFANTVLFILFNQNMLSYLNECLNSFFDDILNAFRPEDSQDQALISLNSHQKPATQNDKPYDGNLGFFPRANSYNKEDSWFNDLLGKSTTFTVQEESALKI